MSYPDRLSEPAVEHQPGDEWRIAPLPDSVERASLNRVAIITEAFLPKIDGVSKLATLTARHHLNMGRAVLIYAPDLTIGDYATPDMLDGRCPVVKVPSGRLPNFPPETRGAYPYIKMDELRRFQPDIVHLFSPAFLAWTGIHYARQQDIPVVANYQTDLPGYTRRYGVGFMEGFTWSYIRHIHNHTTLTLAPTSISLEQLEAKGFKRLRLWYRGCNTQRFNPAKRSAAMRQRMLNGKPDDSLLVVYVGRLANEKRVDLLREVAQLDGVAVAIVGHGPTEDSLHKLFGKTATFLGFLEGEELAQAYASADVFGFTGTNEVAGQVVKEAMASGLPVLVPASGGIVEYVRPGSNGFVCAIDPVDYRDKVITLRDNPALRAEMALNALRDARKLSWEETMARLEQLYTEALRYHRLHQPVRPTLRTRIRYASSNLRARSH
ncbi:MAG: glycosyltransferase family 1 protein [Chloroflexi bacterium]|nr:glycosyltransferase family 1 protein [Chloroflexota bacterium]